MVLPSLTHRAPLIAGRFVIESKLTATLSTDIFKAVSKAQATPALVLTIRGGILLADPAAAEFAQRIRTLSNAGLCHCTEVGVDDENNAFVIMPPVEGVAIASGRVERAEGERRFLSAARIIAKIHELGLCCGDLSPESWWVSRSGEVYLLAPCGIPIIDSEKRDKSSPDRRHIDRRPSLDEDSDWGELLSPEVLAGQSPTASSDVYSLAALGKKILAAFLVSDRGAYLGPIFSAAMSPDPLLRPVSAGMFLEQIQLARSENNTAVATKKSSLVTTGSSAENVKHIAVQVGKTLGIRSAASEQSADPHNVSSSDCGKNRSSISGSRPLVVAALGFSIVASFLLGTGFLGIGLVSRQQQNSPQLADRSSQLEMVLGNPTLEQAVRVLTNSASTFPERQVELEKLTNSDDPLAHELLVRTALGASSDEERLLAERAIVERARRLGMLRSAEQGRTWLRSLQETTLPAEYEVILRLLNANLPHEARLSFLKQVLAHDADLAVRLTAAEALDLPNSGLTELLAQLVSDRTKLPDAIGKALLPLLLADPELAELYGDDVIQRRDQLELADLKWVLPILADRNDSAIRALANLALERSAVSPVRVVFLELLRDREDLSPDVLATLVRASTDKATMADIAVLGRWIDTGAERALLALCATLPKDDPRALEAFDTMAGRSGSVEPASSMVEWIREDRWAQREKFIQVVGALSFADRMTRAEIDETLESFGGTLRDPGLLEVIVLHSGPELSGLLVARFGDKLGMGGLLNLLSHPEKQVRLAAIKGLKDVNEASVLRLVLEKYQQERDSDVKQAYQDNFWVIKERIKKNR